MQAVGEGVKNLAFDLKLPLGPYKLALDRSGRHTALAGASGHLALMDWPRYHLMCETQVKETTHDVCILHNEQFFAAAQKKYVYIYDRTGAEVHCCQEHQEPLALDFLPHHFLLASCGKPGAIHSATGTFSTFVDACLLVQCDSVFMKLLMILFTMHKCVQP
jgi:U3 small nucleolar RNA-associated protein 7